MNPQTIARVFGVLYLITFITSIPAFFVFYAPVLDDPRYIVGAGADNSVALGALLELLPAKLVGRLDAASAPSLAHLRFTLALRCFGNGRMPRELSPR